VTITGTSFSGAKKVTFGGVKATTFSVDSDTQITATVPTSAKTRKIQVTIPGGTATPRNRLHCNPVVIQRIPRLADCWRKIAVIPKPSKLSGGTLAQFALLRFVHRSSCCPRLGSFPFWLCSLSWSNLEWLAKNRDFTD
jgi:hypothetical protein